MSRKREIAGPRVEVCQRRAISPSLRPVSEQIWMVLKRVPPLSAEYSISNGGDIVFGFDLTC
jgi:hypothetical protein